MHGSSDRLRRLKKHAWELGRSALVLILMFTAVHWYATRNIARGLAPPIAGTSLDLRPVKVPSDDGRARLVCFFATWCGVCKAELHNLRALAQSGQLLLVASDSGSADQVRAFAEEHALELPILVDDGTLKRAYAVSSYPTKFFVDAQGAIDFVTVGYTTELGIRLRLLATR